MAVELPSGKVLRRLTLPADPENVDARPGVGTAVVVSARAGAATLVSVSTLRVVKVLHGFGSPHIAAIDPSGRWAYVTDDRRGQLAVISLTSRRVVRKLEVGAGAHHIAVSPDGSRLWIALGERARTIAVVDTTKPARPRVVGHVDPLGGAHDLAFAPGGARVWVTYDDRSEVAVFDAFSYRRLFTIRAGSPPQHVAFGLRYVYLTSGNDGTLSILSPETGRLLRTVRVPLGSYNLGLGGSLVLTCSLTHGKLTELDDRGRLLATVPVAGSTRDVALVVR